MRPRLDAHRGGLGEPGLDLAPLRLEIARIEPDQRLAGGDAITLMHQDGGDRSHELGAQRGGAHRRRGAGRLEGIGDQRVDHRDRGPGDRGPLDRRGGGIGAAGAEHQRRKQEAG